MDIVGKKVKKYRLIRIEGGKPMAVMIKPIDATTTINETKYIKEILKDMKKKPSQEAISQNIQALDMLRKARRG